MQPVDLDALKALYATMLDQIQHAKWTAANRAACKIADAAPALIAELRELRDANRWRPIAEGLPEERLNVLVWDGERACKAFQRGKAWFGDGLYLSRKISHWRLLPDPPEAL